MNKNKLKILIVEDHHIFRLGIKTLLSKQKDFQLIGEASHGTEAIRLVKEKHPDLILLDVHLPKLSGAEVCKEILQQFPQVKILVLSAEKNESYINKMIQAGALGYILKDASATGNMLYDEEAQRRNDRLAQTLNMPVTNFELSVRSRNCLQKMGIDTIGDLTRTSEAELLSSKNFGETSLYEIREMLAAGRSARYLVPEPVLDYIDANGLYC